MSSREYRGATSHAAEDLIALGRMVDEFSAFARMPKPVMERHDVRDIVREAVFLFQVSRPEIAFELDLPDTPVVALSDRRLLAQAVTNLVKNASEAIDCAVEVDASRSSYTAKRGATRRGALGAFVGGLAGAIAAGGVAPPFGPLLGAFAGTFAGAALFEYWSERRRDAALRAGRAAFVGRLLAAAVKTLCGFWMWALLAWRLLAPR